MGGQSSSQQQTQQQQQSQTAPWLPAQGDLTSILSGIGGQVGNYQPNATENSALSQLTQNEQGVQNYAPQAGNLANSYMQGDPTGLLSPALQQYQSQIGGIANQNNDPMQTPGMQNVLNTIQSDVGNSVNQQFAGAGRDLSGLNQQALARGISQGEAAPLLAQYNQNVASQTGAAGNLYNASGQTAGALSGNQAQGINFASAIPTLAAQGPMGILQAQAAARGLPLNNLGMLENLTVPIAGLGGQSSGTGTSNTQGTQQMSGAQQFATIMGGLGSLFKPTISVSDPNAKTGKERIGTLFDGTPVYRFRYIGTSRPTEIGIMADEVRPDAISLMWPNGPRGVDIQLATERAAEMGRANGSL